MYIYIYIDIHIIRIHVYIYIYIYIKREREREISQWRAQGTLHLRSRRRPRHMVSLSAWLTRSDATNMRAGVPSNDMCYYVTTNTNIKHTNDNDNNTNYNHDNNNNNNNTVNNNDNKSAPPFRRIDGGSFSQRAKGGTVHVTKQQARCIRRHGVCDMLSGTCICERNHSFWVSPCLAILQQKLLSSP